MQSGIARTALVALAAIGAFYVVSTMVTHISNVLEMDPGCDTECEFRWEFLSYVPEDTRLQFGGTSWPKRLPQYVLATNCFEDLPAVSDLEMSIDAACTRFLQENGVPYSRIIEG